MSERYQNKYRIPSARATWWDYSADGAYFVTICTKNRTPYFGKVIDGAVHLSEIGISTKICWEAIPEHFPFVALDTFVVMPNHLHGILIMDKRGAKENVGDRVETLHATSLQKDDFMSRISPKPQSLPTIIRSFKSAVCKSARLINVDFAWQPRYHDRIIRHRTEHERIANYIQDNPMNWKEDDFFIKQI